MSSADAAEVLVGKLEAAGLTVTCDPRGATPPCVLVSPPPLTFDLGCGATATWGLWLLAPGPGNLDAWVVLDGMLAAVAEVLPIERSDFLNYSPAPDSPPVPAYRVTYTEGIDL
jgi:hypothetical protein